MDEQGKHVEIVVRDTKHWLYMSFEIDPKRPVIMQAAERLKIRPGDLKIPEHIKRGMEVK